MVSRLQLPDPPMLAFAASRILEACAEPLPIPPPLLVRAPVPPTPVPEIV